MFKLNNKILNKIKYEQQLVSLSNLQLETAVNGPNKGVVIYSHK